MQSSNPANPFILGKFGCELTYQEKKLFTKLNPIGFILYERNLYNKIDDSESVKENTTKSLTQSLKDLFPEREVQIWIDEEGGAVSNIRRAGFKYKSNHISSYEFYEMFIKNGLEVTKQAVYSQFFEIGSKLKSLGFTGTFAPVSDIYYENKSQIIGIRSFGPDIDVVIELCKMSIKALNDVKIDCCIKHFPGHGLAEVDSHLALPIIRESEEFLMKNDFRVFKELAPLVKYAMTAHIIFECIDKKKPITLSKQGIEYVRKNLGFENVKIITDAIDMNALYCAKQTDKNEMSIVEVKNDCLRAGCDIVLYCHIDPETLEKFL